MVVFGARNVHDTLGPEQIQQLIYKNQTITAFNIPSYRPEQIAASVGLLLGLIAGGKLRLFAPSQFALHEVKQAFEALASRKTVGKVVLIPSAGKPCSAPACD
jgi:NADPH2:quinone reductase